MKKHTIFALSVLFWSVIVVLVIQISKMRRTSSSSVGSERSSFSMLTGNRTEEVFTPTMKVDVTEKNEKEEVATTPVLSVSPKKNGSVKTTDSAGTKIIVSSTEMLVTKVPGFETTVIKLSLTEKPVTEVPGTKAPVTQEKRENKVSSGSSTVNPGCKARDVSKYVAPDTNKTYNHPNIVHYAKFNRSVKDAPVTLNFREFISVLSVHKFLKPEKIFFHTFTNFSGHYWDKITSLKDINFEVNVISEVNEIGGKQVGYIEHKADYIKISTVYKHGGTALDFDVIMINGTRWKYLQRKSECVLVEEPGVINGGLYSCIPHAPFMEKWLEGYHKYYKPGNWLYNASFRPMKMLQGRVCYNVHVDRTVCVDPTFKDRDRWLKVKGADWKSKTGAHYYIKSGIPHDGEGLLKEKFSLAELIQYVYNA